jgi:hypothetical protein
MRLQEFFLKVDKGFLYSVWDWYDDATKDTTRIDENVRDFFSFFIIKIKPKHLIIDRSI